MLFSLGKVYPLKNGGMFYYLAKKDKLYKIPQADVRKFNAFRNGFIISLAISALIYSIFPKQLILTIMLGVCSYILISSTFYSRILPKYITMNPKDKKQLQTLTTKERILPMWKSLVIILVGILIIISSFYLQAEKTQQVILIIFGVLLTVSGSNALIKNND
ncbi:hypothetical protein SAMN05421767_12136 [Granulicatella balaenopterae]|uniref:Uncharacterized protein n=1 Tax=Granulicatella balaenopterae TaxID=137733 RepID=A0A1H9LTL0_9LACT|nr:hypothetical protein [Granulicatella balaenopterae]SER14801.1 hypothetical protein SAMN05421767_12136 [Granulicatella balaenopterae]